MDVQRIINELKAERERIIGAITALEGPTPQRARRMTQVATMGRQLLYMLPRDRPVSSPVRKTLSAAHKLAISKAATRRYAALRTKKNGKE